ncbi:hypothetical protein FNV43_RR10260 [Rhamnella rubrinervis]|uniref:RNase H type-1 domain-containing protein n=1 Tax=Rhamnella rubrinervis TaxID=2594499 RepID=A0A8K0HBX0_9ROSA|nr:hypothetical protein FNV43_RR10260 [Rhamnella rubrinervis]
MDMKRIERRPNVDGSKQILLTRRCLDASGSVASMFEKAVEASLSTQNQEHFGNVFIPLAYSLAFIWALTRESNVIQKGTIHNSVSDLLAFRSLGVTGVVSRASQIILVVWSPLPMGLLKVNTNGAADGCLGPDGCDGYFVTSRGFINGSFVVPLDSCYTFESELLGAIITIECARDFGWDHLWLECDSTYVANLLIRREEVSSGGGVFQILALLCIIGMSMGLKTISLENVEYKWSDNEDDEEEEEDLSETTNLGDDETVNIKETDNAIENENLDGDVEINSNDDDVEESDTDEVLPMAKIARLMKEREFKQAPGAMTLVKASRNVITEGLWFQRRTLMKKLQGIYEKALQWQSTIPPNVKTRIDKDHKLDGAISSQAASS